MKLIASLNQFKKYMLIGNNNIALDWNFLNLKTNIDLTSLKETYKRLISIMAY